MADTGVLYEKSHHRPGVSVTTLQVGSWRPLSPCGPRVQMAPRGFACRDQDQALLQPATPPMATTSLATAAAGSPAQPAQPVGMAKPK